MLKVKLSEVCEVCMDTSLLPFISCENSCSPLDVVSGPDVLAAHPDDGPLTPVTVRPTLSLLPLRLGLFHMQSNNKQKQV